MLEKCGCTNCHLKKKAWAFFLSGTLGEGGTMLQHSFAGLPQPKLHCLIQKVLAAISNTRVLLNSMPQCSHACETGRNPFLLETALHRGKNAALLKCAHKHGSMLDVYSVHNCHSDNFSMKHKS